MHLPGTGAVAKETDRQYTQLWLGHHRLPPLIEAVSDFATRAAEKLRVGALQVFAHTSPFRQGQRFYRTATIHLEPPSSDTKVLVGAAVAGVRSIYAPGYQALSAVR